MKYTLLNDNHKKEIRLINLINPILFDLYHKKIYETKKLIDNYTHKWKLYRKYKNIYEYVYTSSNIQYNICAISTISRSYFKLREIIIDLDILNNIKSKIFCMAEGPGGFIQCINDYSNNIHEIYGTTLLSDKNDIPYWSPLIYKYNNVNILEGQDNTGDICKEINRNNIIKIIGKNTCDLITGDGGINYSNDYNAQELNSYKLIYFEILLALQIQKEDGTFIVKMFDLLYHISVQLLYILYICYDKVYIYKPNMSRTSNSEKYIICKGYKLNTDVINIMNKYNNNINKLYINIPETFSEEINKYNNYYIYNQIYSINNIINNIKTKLPTNKTPSILQIKKAIEWCTLYKLPINYNSIYFKQANTFSLSL